MFQREDRYIVVKRTDLIAANLSYAGKAMLDLVLLKVFRARLVSGKAPLECVVVESDWPEYEPTWKAIEERVEAAKDFSSTGSEQGCD